MTDRAPKIHGLERCPPPAPCVDCNDGKRPGGPHHWIEWAIDLDNPSDEERLLYAAQIKAGLALFVVCKHCTAWSADEQLLDEVVVCGADIGGEG